MPSKKTVRGKKGSLKKSSEKKIKLVVFDLDGTLIDAYKAVDRSVNHTLESLGCRHVDAKTIKRNVGWGIRHLVRTFVGEERVDKGVQIYRRHHKDALKVDSKLLPGALRLLKYLKKNKYKIAVASNRPQRFSMIVSRHLDIAKYFDFVLCGDKAKRPKPYPDVLKAILRKFSLKKSEALFVGDMALDVECGNRAGVKAVAIMGGSSNRTEIKEQKPLRIISNIYQIAGIVEELNDGK